jgi:hypothetical protein
MPVAFGTICNLNSEMKSTRFNAQLNFQTGSYAA